MALKLGNVTGGGGGRQVEPVSDWEEATEEFDARSAIISIDGPEGSGKSTLALTMPGPIAYINSDEKIQGIVQPFVKAGKKIRIATYGISANMADKQATLTEAERVWAKVRSWMRDAPTWAKTTIFDTGTEGWEICRLANFGELNPKGNRMDAMYGPVNGEFRTIFKEFRRQHKMLCVLHHVKDQYIDKVVAGKVQSVRTGQQQRAGFKEFGYIANIVIRTGKYMNPETGQVTFPATIEKGWFNAMVEGMTVENEDCRLPYILSLITGVDESEWS